MSPITTPKNNTIRAFIAINLSSQVIHQLEEVSQQVKRELPGHSVRWVAVSNIHLTIKFLGDVSVSNLAILKQTLQIEVARHPAFEFEVTGLGAFPSVSRPRVIWVGVQTPPPLQNLQHGIEGEMKRLGYPPEDRPFSPHLTLGRVARGATSEMVVRISEVLRASRVGSLGRSSASEVHLYQSDLQPGSPIYTPLFSAALLNSS